MASKTNSNADSDRAIAALAYIIFFLPLLAAPESKFGKYHANQGLLLLIFAITINVVGGAIPIIGWFLILPIGWLITAVLFLIGFANALAGKQKPLPMIGNFTIIQ